MPTISVIVPIYNVEKCLDRCVESILHQTFSDFELILVDDGSPDRCGAMCDEWAKKDARIRVIHKSNGGLSDARNAGIDTATGKYLSFVDSDDYVADNFLESLYCALSRNDCMMAVCSIEEFYDNGERKIKYSPADVETVVTGEDMYESLCIPAAWNKLYRADMFADIRYPVGRLFEDAFIYHHLLNKIDKLVYTGSVGYYYYIRSDSIMNKTYNLKNTDIVDAVFDRAKYLDSRNLHKYADEAYLAVYSRLASAYTLLDGSAPEVRLRLDELKKLYDSVYKRMITDKHYSMKQKFRLWLLHVSPSLHVKFFPMNIK